MIGLEGNSFTCLVGTTIQTAVPAVGPKVQYSNQLVTTSIRIGINCPLYLDACLIANSQFTAQLSLSAPCGPCPDPDDVTSSSCALVERPAKQFKQSRPRTKSTDHVSDCLFECQNQLTVPTVQILESEQSASELERRQRPERQHHFSRPAPELAVSAPRRRHREVRRRRHHLAADRPTDRRRVVNCLQGHPSACLPTGHQRHRVHRQAVISAPPHPPPQPQPQPRRRRPRRRGGNSSTFACRPSPVCAPL